MRVVEMRLYKKGLYKGGWQRGMAVVHVISEKSIVLRLLGLVNKVFVRLVTEDKFIYTCEL